MDNQFPVAGMGTYVLIGARSWWHIPSSTAGVSLGLEQCLACDDDDDDNSYPLWKQGRPGLKHFMYILIPLVLAIIPCGRHYYNPYL